MCVLPTGSSSFCRRSHSTVVDFVADLQAHGGAPQKIEHVCQDMSAAYAKGVGMVLPTAQISYDRFHVVAMANEAMDQVRREEVKASPQAVKDVFCGDNTELRKSLTWGMRRNPSEWSAKHVGAMHLLQRSRLLSGRAWRLKMALREVYARAAQSNDEGAAQAGLKASRYTHLFA